MTNDQNKFLNLAWKYEMMKKELDQVRETLDEAMKSLNVGDYFQDPVTKTVFKIVTPKGTFVSYKTISYERTALEGESRGSLSRKEAELKGFDLG